MRSAAKPLFYPVLCNAARVFRDCERGVYVQFCFSGYSTIQLAETLGKDQSVRGSTAGIPLCR